MFGLRLMVKGGEEPGTCTERHGGWAFGFPGMKLEPPYGAHVLVTETAESPCLSHQREDSQR